MKKTALLLTSSLAIVATLRLPAAGMQVTSGSTGQSQPGQNAEMAGTRIRIVRELGVDRTPHIFTAKLEAAYFALGAETARDRLYQMDFHRRALEGRLTEWLYRDNTPPSFVCGLEQWTPQEEADFNTALIEQDRTMRILGYARHNEEVFPQLPRRYKLFLQAYADGVNRTIREISAGTVPIPHAYNVLGIEANEIEAWSPVDSLHCWSRIALIFGGGWMMQNLQLELNNYVAGCPPLPPCDPPIPEYAPTVPPGTCNSPDPPGAQPGQFPSGPGQFVDITQHFSNAWAVHGSRSVDGKPVLVADPKIPVTAPSLLYPFHITLEGANSERFLNVRGAGFAGAPAPVFHWNQFNGYAATSAGGCDCADLFRITPSDTSPETHYVWGSQERPFEVFRESLYAPDGSLLDTFEVKRTLHGPIINDILNGVPFGELFAMRELELSQTQTHSLVAAMRMIEAIELDDYVQALGSWIGPAINLVYAGVDPFGGDPSGHIAYLFAGGIVRRTPKIVCGLDYRGRYPYDGSNPAEGWGAPLTPLEKPHVIDPPQGYVFSGNNRPVGAWYEECVGGYSGIPGIGDTYRSFNLRILFEELFPTNGDLADAAQVFAFHGDVSSRAAEIFRDVLVEMQLDGDLTAVACPDAVDCDPDALDCQQQKAFKVLLGLNAWMNEGAKLDYDSAYWRLVEELLDKMEQISKDWVNHLGFCERWNRGQGGVCWFLQAYRQGDPTALGDAERAWALEAAWKTWDVLMGEGYDPNPCLWHPLPEPIPFRVLYQVNWNCNNPGGSNFMEDENCALCPAVNFDAMLVKPFKNTLNSAASSAMPSMIDFNEPDRALHYLPPGTSENPGNFGFDSLLATWEADARCEPNAVPVAPIDEADISGTERILFYKGKEGTPDGGTATRGGTSTRSRPQRPTSGSTRR